MAYKVSSICIKVILAGLFLLFLQPVKAQYDWTEMDAELQTKQKLLGNNVVAMI
ncbi:MAG: hypothetical protein ACT4OJ_05490 [Bacteroidota bacterium]